MIHQHFRKEEYQFIDKIIEWCSELEFMKLTDFLDTREQHIVLSVSKSCGIQVSFFGGHEGERKRAMLHQDYYTPTSEDFQLVLFEITYATKYVSLTHPQVLGSLLNIGLSRGKFGDILFDNDRIQFIGCQETSSYIQLNVEKIGRNSVQIEQVSFSKLVSSQPLVWKEKTVTVPSLRLDTVLAHVFSVSREKVKLLIENEHAKVNQRVVDYSHFECSVEDVFSLRGFGRAKLIRIDGQTKKEKIRLVVGVI